MGDAHEGQRGAERGLLTNNARDLFVLAQLYAARKIPALDTQRLPDAFDALPIISKPLRLGQIELNKECLQPMIRGALYIMFSVEQSFLEPLITLP